MSLAIVGIAEVPTKRDPERTRWDMLSDVCMGAIRDAGIDKDDIEAVISVNPMAQAQMAPGLSTRKISSREDAPTWAWVKVPEETAAS